MSPPPLYKMPQMFALFLRFAINWPGRWHWVTARRKTNTPLQSAKKTAKISLQIEPWNDHSVEEHGWHPVDHQERCIISIIQLLIIKLLNVK